MKVLLSIGILCNLMLLIVITSRLVCSNDEQVFKINKLNLVWHKAKHSLGTGKLKDFKNDLTKHEFDELTLKKMKAHNQDKDGLFEAAVRKKLLIILTKYNLERYHVDLHPPVADEHDRKKQNLIDTKKDSYNKELKATFRDKRLDKLWKKAEQSSFTQEQLMVLYDEFQHQQDRLDEHYDTLNMIEQEIELKEKSDEKSLNSIESDIESPEAKKKKKSQLKPNKLSKESPSEKKARLDSNVQQVLKEKYSDIKKNIDNLHKKIASGSLDSSEGPFRETAVNKLWQAALNAGFNQEELISLKEELGHYQSRIQKLKHFQIEFEKKKVASSPEKSDDEFDDDTKHLRKRVKELNYKVDKTHKSIEDRILSKREEL